MAKGVHSKRRKRNQAIKRKILDENLWRPRLEETSKRLFKRTFGKGDDSVIHRKKNAFRFPNDPTAEFPQAEKPVFIDKRAVAARREYLVKDTGIKKKNLEKKQILETRNLALKEAETRGAGLEREEEVINMDDMDFYQYGNVDINQLNMDKFSIDEKKKKNYKHKKETGMEIEDNNFGKRGNISRNRNKKKKNKSYYIVNY